MSKYKKYGKGWFKEPRRHSLARQGIKTGRKSYAKQPLGDVWKLETPKEDIYSDKLSNISERAIKGDRKAQNFLRKLWDNESWSSIKKKLKTEGSVWYVWWMDGVRKLISKKEINYQKLSQHPQHILNAPLPDKDKDRVPDIYDWDDDNDGVPDWKDTEGMFSVDRFKGKGVFDPFHDSQVDSDFDGVPDVKDLHPLNPHKARDWAKTNYAKPEIVGQQLRIRVESPRKFTDWGVQDIGRPGYLQRLAGFNPKIGKWQTQSWRLNLNDYKDYGTVAKTIQGLRISPKVKKQARQQARRYFKTNYAKLKWKSIHEAPIEKIEKQFKKAYGKKPTGQELQDILLEGEF